MSNENVFTGITQFDETTGGLKPGELTVITGRVCMGKTALALSMLSNKKTTTRFLYISLEETISQLNPRLKTMTGWLSGKGPLTDYGNNESGYNTEHKHQPIIYMKCPSLLDLQERISREITSQFDAVIIDSLYNIGSKPKEVFGKKNHGQLFRHLKSIAMLISKPIILFADASRIIEKKPLKGAPLLRHYSRIKHVDLLFHLFRWEYYGLEWDNWDDRPVDEGDAMLMKLTTTRDIKTWRTRIKFDSRTGRFE